MIQLKKRIMMAALVLCILGVANMATGADKKLPEPQVWKFATIAPKGIGLGNSIRSILIPAIEEGSDHTLKIDVYWGGVMGDEADYQQKMRIGQIQGAGVSGMAATIFCPEMAVVELPFLFETWDEVDHIKTVMRRDFEKLYEKYGYKLVCWNDQGFDQYYSAKYPLTKLDQFKKAKFGTWYGPVEEKFLDELGANPIPVGVAEAVPAMRQGVADSMIAPAFYVVATQMYPNTKYVNPVRVRYSPALVVVELDAWNSIPELYRNRFFEQRPEIERKIAKGIRGDNKKCLKAMIKYGVEKTEMDPRELEAMKVAARTTWNYFAGKIYSRELLDKLLAHLEEFRKEKK